MIDITQLQNLYKTAILLIVTADETYKCSGCKKDLPRRAFHEFIREGTARPVTSKCKSCRKEDIMAKKWPDTVCACCLKHRKLNSNGLCSKCNSESGLRECYACNKVLPMFLSFTQRERTCKSCRKTTPQSSDRQKP
jgi:hypothetical protein